MSLKVCDKGRVLIVEDNAATRNLYAVIVSEDLPHINVDLAVNGATAVKAFETAHQGIIVMDLHMPVMDGLRAYRQIDEICQKGKWSIPAVIFCTAYAPPEALSDIIAEGKPHCLLNKPIMGDQLVNAVRERL